jgi:hypothetical protein
MTKDSEDSSICEENAFVNDLLLINISGSLDGGFLLTDRVGQESICSQCNVSEGKESDLHGCCWVFGLLRSCNEQSVTKMFSCRISNCERQISGFVHLNLPIRIGVELFRTVPFI